MSDASLYHQALTEYREGRAAPELVSKAYVLAAGSTNPKAQEIEFVKLRVQELKRSGLASLAGRVVGRATSQSGSNYDEIRRRHERAQAARAACDAEDRAALEARGAGLSRTAYFFSLILLYAAFTILVNSVGPSTPILNVVSLFAVFGTISVLLVMGRLKNTGDCAAWAFTALDLIPVLVRHRN